jgi:histidinol-phosphatase (PHP family)
MRDVHVHLLHGDDSGYTFELLNGFIANAREAGLNEIYLLEHTFQFIEFEKVYAPVKAYNEYQRNWLFRRMNGSIEPYLNFIKSVRQTEFPIDVKFGLEVCYIPESENILEGILGEYNFDFLTGGVHWINGWGFDHPAQKELWKSVNVNDIYKSYYRIMCDLCQSGLFTGLAHPDSIKCFDYIPDIDLTDLYNELSMLINKQGMYVENSGGLKLNYSANLELGLNKKLLSVFKDNDVSILTASDAHKQSDVGTNISELEKMLM